MIGFLATALTWLKAFKGPCLILAGMAFLAGAGAATWATRAIMRGDVAEARQQAAADALRERDHAITSAVDAIPAEVARLIAPQFAKLRESVNEPRFDCLRISLPEPYLDGLRRPGGSAAAPDR